MEVLCGHDFHSMLRSLFYVLRTEDQRKVFSNWYRLYDYRFCIFDKNDQEEKKRKKR